MRESSGSFLAFALLADRCSLLFSRLLFLLQLSQCVLKHNLGIIISIYWLLWLRRWNGRGFIGW
jgi:hypothetical protein